MAEKQAFQAQQALDQLTHEAMKLEAIATNAVNTAEVAKQQADQCPTKVFHDVVKDVMRTVISAISAAVAAQNRCCMRWKEFSNAVEWYCDALELFQQPNSSPQLAEDDVGAYDESEEGAVIDNDAIHGGSLDDNDEEGEEVMDIPNQSSGMTHIHRCDPGASIPPTKDDAKAAYEDLKCLLEPSDKHGHRLNPKLLGQPLNYLKA